MRTRRAIAVGFITLSIGFAIGSAACAELLGLAPFEPGPAPSEAGADAPAPGQPETCDNKELDPSESDIDCGGACGKCAKGQKCKSGADCASGACEGNVCVGCVGEKLRDGSACIDRTEVTVDAYIAFRDAGVRLSSREDRARCPTALVHPVNLDEQRAAPNHPVRGVSWCAAKTYCRWRGQRLCGAFDGGGVDAASFRDSTVDQWMAGCTGSARRLYPYGLDDYDPARCNSENKVGGPWDAGATDCKTVGLFVYDMSGNVAEWEDSCIDDRARGTRCRVRGGSWLSAPPLGLRCDADELREAGATDPDVGFRCCE